MIAADSSAARSRWRGVAVGEWEDNIPGCMTNTVETISGEILSVDKFNPQRYI
jgi:hypothetical protein